ncbi:MAG: hypothetical protein ABIJ27_00490 [Candidatus Omnitrophota bacterium]
MLKGNIKNTKDFFELWIKFHGLYKDILKKESITRKDEENFLETKSLILSKYSTLTENFEFRYMPHNRITDPVEKILSVKNLSAMSEDRLKKVEEDWRDSYVFLNSIVERLENKKRRLDRFNPLGIFFKRFFD